VVSPGVGDTMEASGNELVAQRSISRKDFGIILAISQKKSADLFCFNLSKKKKIRDEQLQSAP